MSRTQVRRHDDDGVLEVHHAALRIGQAPLFQNLEQGVEQIGVSLLNLVEEDNGEWLAAHLLGELATLFRNPRTREGHRRDEKRCASRSTRTYRA